VTGSCRGCGRRRWRNQREALVRVVRAAVSPDGPRCAGNCPVALAVRVFAGPTPARDTVATDGTVSRVLSEELASRIFASWDQPGCPARRMQRHFRHGLLVHRR